MGQTINRDLDMQKLSGTRAMALPTRVFEGECWREMSCILDIEKMMCPRTILQLDMSR
jgi:hypothetical protein